jgi:hypothetical protein
LVVVRRYDVVCRICQFALMPSYMQWEEEVCD